MHAWAESVVLLASIVLANGAPGIEVLTAVAQGAPDYDGAVGDRRREHFAEGAFTAVAPASGPGAAVSAGAHKSHHTAMVEAVVWPVGALVGGAAVVGAPAPPAPESAREGAD